MTDTLAYGYSSESAEWELSNEYQHGGRVNIVFKNLRVFLLWAKLASVLEGLDIYNTIQYQYFLSDII